jgi:hypothetical protein
MNVLVARMHAAYIDQVVSFGFADGLLEDYINLSYICNRIDEMEEMFLVIELASTIVGVGILRPKKQSIMDLRE